MRNDSYSNFHNNHSNHTVNFRNKPMTVRPQRNHSCAEDVCKGADFGGSRHLCADPAWIGTIIGAIVIGLIVGALARLVMPGKQNIGIIVTILLGVVGSFLGSWISYQVGYSNSNGGFAIIPFLSASSSR